MANKEAWKGRERHNWFGTSHGPDRSRVSVFANSEKKEDGSLHPIKVNLKSYYRNKDGKEFINYIDIPAYMLGDVINDLQQAKKLNDEHFKGQVTTRDGSLNVKVPDSFGKKK